VRFRQTHNHGDTFQSLPVICVQKSEETQINKIFPTATYREIHPTSVEYAFFPSVHGKFLNHTRGCVLKQVLTKFKGINLTKICQNMYDENYKMVMKEKLNKWMYYVQRPEGSTH
jgi:hypothetical protein